MILTISNDIVTLNLFSSKDPTGVSRFVKDLQGRQERVAQELKSQVFQHYPMFIRTSHEISNILLIVIECD